MQGVLCVVLFFKVSLQTNDTDKKYTGIYCSCNTSIQSKEQHSVYSNQLPTSSHSSFSFDQSFGIDDQVWNRKVNLISVFGILLIYDMRFLISICLFWFGHWNLEQLSNFVMENLRFHSFPVRYRIKYNTCCSLPFWSVCAVFCREEMSQDQF